jgi:hypothetical protein
VPIYLCHARADGLVPWAGAEALYVDYGGPKWHFWSEGAAHALCSWPVLGRLVETFTAIEAGRLPLGRHIDEVPDLGVSRDSVRWLLPGHLAELRRLLRGPAPQRHGRAARREEGRRLR